MAGRLSEAEAERFGVDSYDQRGATRTRANSTLFIAFRDATVKVPAAERGAYVEGLFHGLSGYVGVRQVRGMVFVDFDSIRSATGAMMKHQGQHGLTIDYDKDVGVANKRKREQGDHEEKAVYQATSSGYYCARCGTKALRTKGKLLSAMPSRGTDGARVVDESSQLLQMLMEPVPGQQPARVQRAKGVEKQFRLGCRSCGAALAYRSVAVPAEGTLLYVDADALRDRPPTAIELQQQQQQQQPSPPLQPEKPPSLPPPRPLQEEAHGQAAGGSAPDGTGAP